MNKKWKNIISFLSVAVFIAFFILASYLAMKYESVFMNFAYLQGIFGMITYILITVIAVVIAPISTLPLLPVAVALWGSFFAAVLSIMGWTIGAMIAFWLSRSLGHSFLAKVISLDKIIKASEAIPEDNLFLGVVFLRMRSEERRVGKECRSRWSP